MLTIIIVAHLYELMRVWSQLWLEVQQHLHKLTQSLGHGAQLGCRQLFELQTCKQQ